MSDPMTNEEITQQLASLLFAVATSEDWRVSNGGGDAYEGLETALRGMIAVAYPDVDVARVMHVFHDCNESIDYCVAYVRREMADEATERVIADATDRVNSAATNDDAIAVCKSLPMEILRGVADLVYADMDDEPSRATLTRRIIAAARTGE